MFHTDPDRAAARAVAANTAAREEAGGVRGSWSSTGNRQGPPDEDRTCHRFLSRTGRDYSIIAGLFASRFAADRGRGKSARHEERR